MSDTEDAGDPMLASMAEASRTLLAAGWRPFDAPVWGGTFVAGRAVGGIAPNGTGYIKHLDIVQEGHPQRGPDYPDEHHEAAAWLAERYSAAKRYRFRRKAVAPTPEAEKTPAHEAHAETGGEAGSGAQESAGDADAGIAGGGDLPPEDVLSAGSAQEGSDADSAPIDAGQSEQGDGVEESAASVLGQPEPIDADFSEPVLEGDDLEAFAQIEAPDLGAEILETEQEESPQGSDRFIGLDDLDRRRSLRIGDVTVAAANRFPIIDWPKLAELRNFAMGVSEGRWPNDEAKQAELVEAEAVASRRRQIEMLRDQRVNFLIYAMREEVEAFDPEADWP